MLQEIHPLTGRFELIFAGNSDVTKPMSENTINKSLRNLGYDTQADVCGHGFRTMACSALNESGLWFKDAIERAIERQMSHVERNSVRAAYIHKAEYLSEHRLMMQWWADFLDAQNPHTYIEPSEFAKLRNDSAVILR
ncbi:tyrosine-type recombinase/integrase [Chromobacterium sphagni]|uniref:tyrosine-type recombinase/integrase n=1 Tax=Chromobacterium sphagni TaxID=1903179 RepID=UPI001F4EE278|nr:hypothetical protein [Chromobacterium sphagni]